MGTKKGKSKPNKGSKKKGSGLSSSSSQDNSSQQELLYKAQIEDADWETVTLSELREALSKAPGSARKAVLEDEEAMAALRDRKDGPAFIALLLAGNMGYEQDYMGLGKDEPKEKSDFTKEVIGGDTDVEEFGLGKSLNCWQFIMFAQGLAGSLDTGDLHDFYDATGKAKDWTGLGYPNKYTELSEDDEPDVGDVVLEFNKYSAKMPSHAMIYVGGGKVVSHHISHSYVRSLSDMGSHKLYFGRAPWM